ncbi:SPFH domain-containing protein [Mycoplasma sp. HU2014]|uniref:SPFH domain-containing protein n=1 Tax=Mycoplasma sp. HU2014 TaxID=1664275 RepID=UPI00067DD242|nr:SPFH domain-containing protein [Mycoplasma sp. HU2014]KNG78979.1 putative FtsH protease regulator HflK [Mycoplasma sp. HU2014]
MQINLIITIVVIAILLLIIVGFLASAIKIVRQGQTFVIERMGKYIATWETGIHFKLPIIDHISQKISLKEQVYDFPPQPVITKDNVTMQIDTVIYFQVVDPKSYAYGVEKPISAIENLTATTLRNIIGELDLDQALTSREFINDKMRLILDEATDPWGIKVIRVELKNIIPPKDIREAMEKQMRAEREKREAILIAEGQKRSDILKAEGYKEAKILSAEADKTAQILYAEAEAEKILKIQKATADGIKMINEAKPGKELLTLRSYESLVEVSKGSANKLIIPSNLQEIVGLAKTIKFSLDDKN